MGLLSCRYVVLFVQIWVSFHAGVGLYSYTYLFIYIFIHIYSHISIHIHIHLFIYTFIIDMYMNRDLPHTYLFTYIFIYTWTSIVGPSSSPGQHNSLCFFVFGPCPATNPKKWSEDAAQTIIDGEVGGWGRVPFSRNFMKPTPRRKWYLTTGRRFH